LDSLDVAVLRWLMMGFEEYPARAEIRESYSLAAKRLNVSEGTLRNRILRLEESGYLSGLGVFLNPNGGGQHMAAIRLDVLPPSAKDAVVRKLELIEGVWRIMKCQSNSLILGTYYEDDASLGNKVELMSRIANSENIFCREIRFPACDYEFKPMDFDIIRCVQESPRMRYETIAKRTHLSTKTVWRRLNKMIQDRAIFVTLKLDATKSKGAIIANLILVHQCGEDARELEQKAIALVGDSMFSAILGSPGFCYFELMLDNVAKSTSILNEAKRLDNVEDAYMDIVEEDAESFIPFREQVERLAMTRSTRTPKRVPLAQAPRPSP
jgi:DNA-binding Lrp family transcriptional regulator